MLIYSRFVPASQVAQFMRLFGWLVIFMVPVVVLVGNWISTTMDPERCPVGLVCVHAR